MKACGLLFMSLLCVLTRAQHIPNYEVQALDGVFDFESSEGFSAGVAMNDHGDIVGRGQDRNTVRILRDDGSIDDTSFNLNIFAFGDYQFREFNKLDQILGWAAIEGHSWGWNYDPFSGYGESAWGLYGLTNSGTACFTLDIGVYDIRTSQFEDYQLNDESFSGLDMNSDGLIVGANAAWDKPFRFGPNQALPLELGGYAKGRARKVLEDGTIFGSVGDTSATERLAIWNADGSLRQTYRGPDTVYSGNLTNAHGLVTIGGISEQWLFTESQGFVPLSSLIVGDGPRQFHSFVSIADTGKLVMSRYEGTEWNYYALNPVPEPGVLLTLGLGWVLMLRRKRVPIV